jgi:beta-lactamase class A
MPVMKTFADTVRESPPTRRAAIRGLGAALLAACSPASAPRATAPRTGHAALEEIEASVGGRVGVFALDTGSGGTLARREDERFAMCSTFKLALVATVLARVDRGELALDARLPYGKADLVPHAPVTSEHLAEGSMTIEALARAAMTVSDNTATNLLLGKVGGPSGVTAALRRLGDPVTRLDRDEPTVNENAPNDPRDTTSPRAMVGLMRTVLVGDALSAVARERLLGWLRACETGKNRLRGGLPQGWIAGDKTGTGERGAVNDVAVAWPPGRAPILVAAYLSDGEAGLERLVAAHGAIGRLVGATLG